MPACRDCAETAESPKSEEEVVTMTYDPIMRWEWEGGAAATDAPTDRDSAELTGPPSEPAIRSLGDVSAVELDDLQPAPSAWHLQLDHVADPAPE